jgi:hypothetical protein
VYSERYDFFFYLEDLIVSIARLWFRLKFNGIEEEHADIMKKSSKSLSALVVTRRER